MQAFSRIFADIWRCSCIFIQADRRATKGWRGPASPAVFSNIKKCSDFGKKGLHCDYLWVKFSIENEFVYLLSFLLVFLTKWLSKCPSSTKPPLPWKLHVVRLYSDTIVFAECSILNNWHCSECAFVLITAQ